MDSLRGFVASCEALFSFAGICVIRGCFCCGLELGKSLGVFLFALTGIGNNRLEVEMEFLGDFLSGLADLLDGIHFTINWIRLEISFTKCSASWRFWVASLSSGSGSSVGYLDSTA